MSVIVLGSLNMDIVMKTNQLPIIGQTLLGEDVDYFIGGKGANQAVAASRVNDATTLIGTVGNDAFADKILTTLNQESLTLQVTKENNHATGIAAIFKLPQDNAIVVLPGANATCTIDETLVQQWQATDTFLTQLEIPLATVATGLKLAKQSGLTTILNPAPFHVDCLELLPDIDIITPNETEFAQMIGKEFTSDEALEAAMLAWSKQHATRLLVTRGKQGTSFVENNSVTTIPALAVTVVDTTGAGDTFNGLLAAELAEQKSFADAVRFATIGASLSVQQLGAQSGMPTREAIHSYM
ncbi:ribokinase [Enterococcus saccharolyticus]|uniref:Ribokinase n=1 Tax=Enterococcus saccharolyticus subsp. saccharolyticus ATCC 43076 TaxID=1139996 RepID=S0NLL8_9ENTE|nr:ribokinase [Enterococcus saccharolyticus]EOT28075.1 ribokinase [Enterococcus saccharolyticus subsp. saccharolyticus ATCC 43076]EOT77453.1 ribokinase [Enterococcus saccharolyticus subsp. saccharolyticus ATCC 43076]OJG90774.1 ribokinase [Enterococcus saccharolyticus]